MDPKGQGFIDIERLEKVFSVLGYAKLDEKDKAILLECLGHEQKITLKDLKDIFENENLWVLNEFLHIFNMHVIVN